MITPEQMTALQDALEKIAEPVTDYIIKDVIRRIMEAGQITRTAEYLVKQAFWLRNSRDGLIVLLRKKNVPKAIINTFTKAADIVYKQMGAEPDEISDDILKAAIKLATQNFTNLTQTIGMVDPFGVALPMQQAYRSCTDYAFKMVLSGAQSYQQACYEASKNLIDQGVRVIDYESGRHTSVDAAIRRNIFGGMGLMVEQLEEHLHDQMGANGWELSAHEACAKDHEPYQGRQFTNAQYERLNGTATSPGILKRRIGTLNCKHIAFPVILGVQKPIYSQKELADMRARNRAGVTFEGKHYTMYEATQMQRQIERAIRNQKRRITAFEQLPGQQDKLRAARIKYIALSRKYKEFSSVAGLRTQDARLLVEDFGPSQERRAYQVEQSA